MDSRETSLGMNFCDHTLFESCSIDRCQMLIVSCLPSVVYVDIPTFKPSQKLRIFPPTHTESTFPLIPGTKNVEITLGSRHLRVKMTQLPYSVAFMFICYKIQSFT